MYNQQKKSSGQRVFKMDIEIRYKKLINTKDIFRCSLNKIYKLCLKGKLTTVYEIIKDNPVKLYIDVDVKSAAYTRDDLLATIRDRLSLEDNKYFIFDSSYSKKISFRIIYDRLYFTCGKDMIEYVKSLNIPGVDLSVYKEKGKMQLLRAPYTTKEGESRYFKKVDENGELIELKDIPQEEFAKYFVNNIEGGLLYEREAVSEDEEESVSVDTIENCTDISVPAAQAVSVEPIEKPEAPAVVYSYEAIIYLLNCLLDEDGAQEFDYHVWTHIIWALKNTFLLYTTKVVSSDEDGRKLAHNFSKMSIKYKKDETDRTYDAKLSKDTKPLSIAYIIKLAKETNEDAYFQWKNKYNKPDPIKKLLNSYFADGDIADAFCDIYRGKYIYNNTNLFHFNGNFWKKINESKLFDVLNELYFELNKLANNIYKDDVEKHKNTMKKVLQLRDYKRLKNYVELIKTRIVNDEVKFDMNGDLLPFLNGVYELDTDKFREGRPEDYISLVLDYDFEESDTVLNHANEAFIMEFFNKIMPMKDERDFLLKCLSTCLRGQTLEKFIVLTGEGGNGKDALINLLSATLGDYYYNAPNTVLTEKTRGDLDVGVASMEKMRCVMYNEPDKSSKIRTAKTKEITGGKNINARKCHSNENKIRLHGTHFCACNDLLRLDEVGEAMMRRLEVIPFRSLFRPKEVIQRDFPEGRPYLYESNDFYKTDKFAEKYKIAFLHILLRYYKIFRSEGYELVGAPQTCVELVKQYINDSNDFYNWFMSVYEKSPHDFDASKTCNNEDFLQIKDIFNDFKNSSYYQDLSKADRRNRTLKKMIVDISTNHNFRLYYKERCRPIIDGKQKEFRNVLMKYRYKKIEDEENDE